MAGIIVRLHAMAVDGVIALAPSHAKHLHAAVECVFRPFERGALGHGDGNGHYHGALYMQCAVPFLCAWRAGTAIETLRTLVQRAGRAIVRPRLRGRRAAAYRARQGRRARALRACDARLDARVGSR
eukprot:6016301-Prymnesium_polylepis.1